jgi:hypothetical protein
MRRLPKIGPKPNSIDALTRAPSSTRGISGMNLSNDDLTTEDILAVCRSGAIVMASEKDIKTGQWKYRIEGITAESSSNSGRFHLQT